jgi:tRNA pseudouridine55 synthase
MNGFFSINKPSNMLSMDITRVIKRLFNEKTGHIGTLDPLAQGVLPIAVGPATRLIDFVHSQSKEYVATILLGLSTDTDDITGQIIEKKKGFTVSIRDIEKALTHFQGSISQVPPVYSAVKVKGKRAYNLARHGEDVELKENEVRVHSIDILGFKDNELKVKIECGSGTYIRGIARDLGKALGCGGCLKELIRTRVGVFTLSNSIRLEDCTRESLINPMDVISLPVIDIEEKDCITLRNGCFVNNKGFESGHVWLKDISRGKVFALGIVDEALVKPKIVFKDEYELIY